MISKIQSKWRLILGFLIMLAGIAFSESIYIGVPIVVVGLGFAFWQTLREKKSKRGSI